MPVVMIVMRPMTMVIMMPVMMIMMTVMLAAAMVVMVPAAFLAVAAVMMAVVVMMVAMMVAGTVFGTMFTMVMTAGAALCAGVFRGGRGLCGIRFHDNSFLKIIINKTAKKMGIQPLSARPGAGVAPFPRVNT